MKLSPRQPPHPLCAYLRELRHAAGLSLTDIRNLYGVPPVVLGSYERGDREPSLRKIDDLYRILYDHELRAVPIGATATRLHSTMVEDLRAIADQLARAQLHTEAVVDPDDRINSGLDDR